MEEKYQFTERAKKEIKENFKYYNFQNPKIADEFLKEVYEKVEQISEKPEAHSIIYKDIRRASLKRFPFFIYYTFRNMLVYILSVWHKKRKNFYEEGF